MRENLVVVFIYMLIASVLLYYPAYIIKKIIDKKEVEIEHIGPALLLLIIAFKMIFKIP